MALTNRERYLRLFAGQSLDRVPFLDIMGFWNSSLERWKREGLSPDATADTVRAIVGFDGRRGIKLPVQAFVWPEYDRQVLQEDGERLLIRNRFGGTAIDMKGSEVMSLTHTGPVHDRAGWEAFKSRLDPEAPGRFPLDWAAVCDEARASGETVYAGDLPIGFFGGPRELLGLERQVTLFYDDPSLMHAILDHLCDLWLAVYRRLQEAIVLDWFFVWEDMCFKGGPLISPATFREFLLPRYKRLIAGLRAQGCSHMFVDSDGDVRQLVPLWLEAGIDITFPWESQFGLDLIAARKLYPRMGIIGGLDKFALAHGREAIDAELAKVPFMLEHGRYIPGLDHGVPNDVSWDNYRYFYERLRELIWRYPPNPD